MPKFTGTIKKNDLEGGFFELHTDDGERYQLSGGDDGLRKDGQSVTIEGSIDKGAMGIGMTGPTIKVKSWQKS